MVDYNPYAPDVQHNPYPMYRRLRDEAPVCHNVEMEFYALSRYDDVLAAFLDPKTFISGAGVMIGPKDENLGVLIALDPPEHTMYRKLLAPLFTPRRITELEPFVRGVAVQYLDAVRDADRFDLVQDFSLRLPLDVIGELIGLPAEYRSTIHDLAIRTLARDPDPAKAGRPSDDALGAIIEMFTMLLDLVVERRKHPRDDVISMLVQSEIDDDDGRPQAIPDEMIAAQFQILAVAGHETVTKLIGNGAVALAWYPDQRRELVEDPRLVPSAVEEVLRWDNPAGLEGRWCVRDVELHGVTIPAESRVLLVMGAANHDERQYEHPELFDIHRRSERPLVFGFGIHLCLGAALARLEARVALEELLARFPEYEIDETGVRRGPPSIFRGFEHLPVVPIR